MRHTGSIAMLLLILEIPEICSSGIGRIDESHNQQISGERRLALRT